ncbi:MAG TPA: hypothetical protein VLC79_14655 [Cellvibrio sp.]|nr:hypothetical protein [Cellvibrio sp.]
MNPHDSSASSTTSAAAHGDAQNADPTVNDKRTGITADIEQTLQLGEQFLVFFTGAIDLARVEAMLALRTIPRVLMLWLLMMPVILLTWCSFSALTSWAVYAASEEIGLGIFMFFLQQLLLLLSCRWLFLKYRLRMTMPYTRAQLDTFMRSMHHGFGRSGETKE